MKRYAGFVLGVLLVACGGSPVATESSAPAPTTSTSARPPAPPTAASSAAADAIASFATGPEQLNSSFAAIHRHVNERPADVRVAALDQLPTATGDVRYAALYALSLTAEGDDAFVALHDALESVDVDERMLAAGSLVARGDKAALPVLIEMLGSAEDLAFRDPPQAAWEFARFVLLRYTAEDLGLLGPRTFSAVDAAAAQPAWATWWIEHGDRLEFDAEQRLYR